MTASIHRRYGAALLTAVAITLAFSFQFSGTPSARQQHRPDERRLEDRQTIAQKHWTHCIGSTTHDPSDPLIRPLPATLEEASDLPPGPRLSLRDPVTGEPYGYALLDAHTFELTASFDTVRDREDLPLWNHGVGVHMFRIDLLQGHPTWGR